MDADYPTKGVNIPRRSTLEERTRERVPLEWAGHRVKRRKPREGVALMIIADRTDDFAKTMTALKLITEALEAARESGHAPLAAEFDENLPQAQSLVERLNKS